MAATKLNPAAPPFHCHYMPYLSPPAFMLPHLAVAFPSPPTHDNNMSAPFPVPSPPHHPLLSFSFREPQQQDLFKGGVPAAASAHGFLPELQQPPCKGVPTAAAMHVLQPDEQLAFCKGVPVAIGTHGLHPEEQQALCMGIPAAKAHRVAMHKLISSGGAEKRRVMVPVAMKARQKPSAAAAAVVAPDHVPAAAPWEPHSAVSRDRGRTPRPRKAAGPRNSGRLRPRSPSPLFTRKLSPRPHLPPPHDLGSCTTVMVRNIPNKLSGHEMIRLLDDHCARENRAAGSVVSSYDVVYLPLDFRRHGNFGYAFVNLTTAEAALGLREALHGRGWKVPSSKKIIEIYPAKIQGKQALVNHFSRQKFECGTDEFLPAVFSPPRDGVTQPPARRVGKVVDPPRRTAPPPRLALAGRPKACVHRKVQS